MSDQIFDEMAWRAVCMQCAGDATSGTGLSETLFLRNLHGLIHMHLALLAPGHRAHALAIAREFGYADIDELQADAQWNAENGFCAHGIEWNHCPAGCELDESDEEFDDLNVALDESSNEIC